MIEFECTSCGTWQRVSDNQAGQRLRCTTCSRSNNVPGQDASKSAPTVPLPFGVRPAGTPLNSILPPTSSLPMLSAWNRPADTPVSPSPQLSTVPLPTGILGVGVLPRQDRLAELEQTKSPLDLMRQQVQAVPLQPLQVSVVIPATDISPWAGQELPLMFQPLSGGPPLESPIQELPTPVEESYVEEDATALAVAATPSFLTSLMVHAAALVTLGVWTIVTPDDPITVMLVADPMQIQEDIERLATVEIDQQVDTADLTFDAVTDAPGQEAVTELNQASPLNDLPVDSGMFQSGLFDKLGQGWGANAGGGKGDLGKAVFFGTEAQGNKFVYVVDASGSMTGTRIEKACAELLRSVQTLGTNAQFYVIFFSDRAYPMYDPKIQRTMVKPTTLEIRKLTTWMRTLSLGPSTEPRQALEQAVVLKPDVIFLLTDGTFSDSTSDLLLNNPDTIPYLLNPGLSIHTIAFEEQAGEAVLKAIAEKYRGKYKYVK